MTYNENMQSIVERIIPDSINPLKFFVYSIKWVIAVMTLIGGAYLFTPLYEKSQTVNGSTPFADAISNPWSSYIWAGVLVVGSLLVIFGLVRDRPQIRSLGFFMIFLARFFQVLTTWLVVGLFPINWIYPFTLMLITIILWGMARTEVLKNVS